MLCRYLNSKLLTIQAVFKFFLIFLLFFKKLFLINSGLINNIAQFWRVVLIKLDKSTITKQYLSLVK